MQTITKTYFRFNLAFILFIVLSYCSSIMAQDLENDAAALLKFYDEANGEEWGVNWAPGVPIGQWAGISVVNDRVQKLSLIGLSSGGNIVGDSLYGEFIPDLYKLDSLKTLEIIGVNLSGLIDLENFTALQHIEVRKSLINDILHFESAEALNFIRLRDIQNCSHVKFEDLVLLKYLSLTNLGLDSLDSFDNLILLESLYFSENNITVVPDLSNNVNLEIIVMSFNPIQELPDLSALILLEEINVAHMQLETLPDLTQLINLKILNGNANALTKFPNVNENKQLERIQLGINFIDSVPSLEELVELRELYLLLNNISYVADLSKNTSLEVLSLSRNKIDTLTGIENLTNLLQLDLARNNFRYINDLSNLTAMTGLTIDENNLTTLPTLPQGNEDLTILMGTNKIPFKELEEIENYILPNLNLSYTPQAPCIGLNTDDNTVYGRTIRLSIPEGGDNTLYTWIKNDTTILGTPNGTENFIILDSINLFDKGVYRCDVSNTAFPLTSYSSEELNLQIFGEDSLGGLFIYDQLIVEYDEGATQAYRDSLRAEFDASLIDKCQCGEFLELWQLDSLAYHGIEEIDSITGDLVYITDPDEIKKKTKRKARVNDVGYNYTIDVNETPTQSSVRLKDYTSTFLSSPPPPNENASLILIDTGLDSLHNWTDVLWTNEEAYDSINCQIGDIHGYNFLADTSYTIDQDNGHGTHLAGIVIDELIGQGGYDIINAKVFGDEGYGELFDAICAIYYGIDNKADVYNLSWGYYGAPVSILENALKKTDALLVSSAGNGIDGVGVDISVDTSFHFPASFDLENMVSVAAWDKSNNTIAEFSNYSSSLVHIAAVGVNINPGIDYETKSGTSQAAAAVSAAALCLKIDHPDWGYTEIKEELLSNVNVRFELSDKTISGGFLGDCQDGQIVFVEDLAIEENVKFKLYPNPFGNLIHIEILDPERPHTIRMYNLQGQRVYAENLSPDFRYSIDTGNLSSGIYFLEMVFEKERVIRKLIKSSDN